MASQVTSSTGSQLEVLEIQSFARGYHAYMDNVNKTFAEITRSKLNRGAGYGLEVPVSMDVMRIVDSLQAAGHL